MFVSFNANYPFAHIVFILNSAALKAYKFLCPILGGYLQSIIMSWKKCLVDKKNTKNMT